MAISRKGGGNGHRGRVLQPNHAEALCPTRLQRESAHGNVLAGANIARMHREDACPNAEENLNRLLKLKITPCKHSGCKHRAIHWTPKGIYCSTHRDEAIEVMRECGKVKYGFN